MIRVNLLPTKKETRGGAAGAPPTEVNNRWLIGVLGILVVESVLLFLWYISLDNELVARRQQNEKISANIGEIKRQISNHGDVKAQLKELRDREEAIGKLQSARIGPTATLLELSRMLTPGKGPTTDRDKLEQLKRDNPGSVPNPNRDPRRLWLLSYNEVDRNLKITGSARDGEDVSEFLRRITLSDYFFDVRLLPASKSVDSATKIELVRFEISAKVRY